MLGIKFWGEDLVEQNASQGPNCGVGAGEGISP